MSPADCREKNLPVFLQLSAATKNFLVAADKVETETARLSLAFLNPMWLHSHAMCDTLRPRGDGQVMWNLPALANSARTMLECFIGLAHFAQAKDAQEEELRALLWHRQTNFKVADILKGGPESDSQNAEIAARLMDRVAEIEIRIKDCAAFSLLDGPLRHRLLHNREQYLTLLPIDIWEQAGLQRSSYYYAWRTLSQWAHVTPLALHLQAAFPDDRESLVSYTNGALGTAFTTLSRAPLLTVQRSPELDTASAPIAAILPQFLQ